MLYYKSSSCQDLHDFLGLNEPFFNHSSDVVFTAQEGGIAYLSCEVMIILMIMMMYMMKILMMIVMMVMMAMTVMMM